MQQREGVETRAKDREVARVVVSNQTSTKRKGTANMAHIPPVADLYGGDPMLTDGVPTPNNSVGTPKPGKLVARHEQYQKQIKAAIHEGLSGETVQVGSTQYAGQSVPLVKSRASVSARLERGLDSNGLQKGQKQIISEHMEYLEKSSDRLAKEWSLSSPVPTGLVPLR